MDTYETTVIYAIKAKYQREIASRHWCRRLSEKMLAPYKTVDPVYLFCPFGQIENVEVIDTDSTITLMCGETSKDFCISGDIFQIITYLGVQLPKTEGLTYSEKLKVVKDFVVPFAIELEEYLSLEEIC